MSWLPWAWVAVAVVLAGLELATGTFMLLIFALAALLPALAAFAGASLGVQALLFLVGVAAGCAAAPALARRANRQSWDSPRFGVDALLGENALVVTAIDPVHGTGGVRVKGQDWRATARVAVPVGTLTRVAEINGATLTVLPLPEAVAPRLAGEESETRRLESTSEGS
ncbi:MAG: NfeD family protein [Fimbriimonadaceae bacterium]|nr:NfeD family protein [Fimbriimonadaceae bacterium]